MNNILEKFFKLGKQTYWICDACDRVFKTRKELLNHFKTHDKEEDETFKSKLKYKLLETGRYTY